MILLKTANFKVYFGYNKMPTELGWHLKSEDSSVLIQLPGREYFHHSTCPSMSLCSKLPHTVSQAIITVISITIDSIYYFRTSNKWNDKVCFCLVILFYLMLLTFIHPFASLSSSLHFIAGNIPFYLYVIIHLVSVEGQLKNFHFLHIKLSTF